MALWLPTTDTGSYSLSTTSPFRGGELERTIGYGVPLTETDPYLLDTLGETFPILGTASIRDGVPLLGAVNYVANPSTETSTLNMNGFPGSTTGSGGSCSASRITTDSRFGAACTSWAITPQTGGTGWYTALFHQQYSTLPLLQSTAMPVTPGQTVWLTGSSKVVSGNIASIQLIARFHDVDGTFLSQPVIATQNTPVTGTWYDLAGSVAVPAGAAYALVRIQLNHNDTTATVALTDGVLISLTNPYGFFDGNSQACEWEGTANLSRSHRRIMNELTNPSVANVISPWSSGGGPVVLSSVARTTADGIDGHCGEASFQSGTNAGLAMQIYPSVTTPAGGPIRANPGEVFSGGAWVKIASGGSGVSTVRCDVGFKDGTSGAFITQTSGPTTPVVPGTWQFVKCENISVPGSVPLNGVVYLAVAARCSGVDTPVVMRADRAMLVRQPTLPQWYIAGDQPGGQWTGAANASTSIQLV